MPYAAPRACNAMGCPNFKPCPLHSPQRAKNRRTDAGRLSPDKRGYDHTWRRLRLSFFKDRCDCTAEGRPQADCRRCAGSGLANAFCRECLKAGRQTLATEIHHRVKVSERPDLRLDWDNLVPLCRTCHNAITARNG